MLAEALLLAAFLPVVFQRVASLLEKGIGRLWGGDVQNNLEELHRKLSLIQAVLQDADKKQHTNEAIEVWLSNLKDAAYEADDILDEFDDQVTRRKGKIQDDKKGKVCHFFSCYDPLLFNKTTSRKINEVVEKINRLTAETSLFQLQGNNDAMGHSGNVYTLQTHSFEDERKIRGREEEKEEIMELLITSNDGSKKGVLVLPIFGIGGVGKTTMARLIYNDKQVANYFRRRMWVCVSNDFNVPRMIKAILESAEIKCESSNMEELQRKLRDVLRAERFLLVLDDVWNENPLLWEQLEVLLTSGAEGSAVVVTTRSEKVSKIVGTVDPYPLRPLSEDDCWILFKERAFVRAGREETENLLTIGRAIVRKCGGLPLAVKALGSLMAGKREEWEWRSVMDSEVWELEDDVILPSLRLSYHQLPSYMKPCFSYCAIFPKDYEIDRDMLIQLWMASGFIPSDDSTVDLELKGRKIFDELVSRCFFQDVKEGPRFVVDSGPWMTTCTMHDLIHDLAQSIMGSGCHVLDKPADISNRKTRHLSVTIDPKLATLDKVQDSKTMRTLLLLGDKSGSPDFPCISLPETRLRVLGLSRCNMKKLPISLHQLGHLRYLGLSFTDVATLPEGICNLVYLQTLNLNGCDQLSELPRGLGKMSSLRHLHLAHCWGLRYMPRGIGRLRSLHTLTAYHVGPNEEGTNIGGGIEELKDLNNIGGHLCLSGLDNVRSVADAEHAKLGSKDNLEILELGWDLGCSNDELKVRIAPEVVGALKPPRNVRRLAVDGYIGNHLGTWLTGDLKRYRNLVRVSFVRCHNLISLPAGLGCLKALQNLGIYGCKKLISLPEGLGRLTSLVHLEIDGLPELTSLPDGMECLEELQILCICGCPKLISLPQGLQHRLPFLRRLWIKFCPSLEALCSRGGEYWSLVSDIPKLWIS